MITRKLGILALAAAATCGAWAAKPAVPAAGQSMDDFISSLMSQMTLDEKLGQINLPPSDDIVTGQPQNSNIGAAVKAGIAGGTFNIKGAEKIRELQRLAVEESRLGIPLIIGMDVIHGYETVFPIPLALSCSWNLDAIERSARIAAVEASAGGICWTFSPMVDVARDARWGRMSEGSGEDPYLGACIARAMVRGYQGKDMSRNDEIMACVKHFALYGAPEAGRDYNTVDMSRLRMYNEYFLPYQAGAQAGAGSFMTSFNVVDGVPATANRWLIDDVLRKQWGFDGFVVTDYASIAEMPVHGVGTFEEATVRALKAGTDMDMSANAFVSNLKKALEQGQVTMNDIDTAVRRVLEAKWKLGLFASPYKYNDTAREKTDVFTPEHRAEARRIAAQTFVLLKNEGNVLPLEKKGTILLTGPLANTAANMPGTWSVAVDLKAPKTVLEGMRDAVGNDAKVLYAKGSNLYADAALEAASTVFGREMRDSRSDAEMLAEALELAKQADVIVAAVGEASESSGESSSRSELELPDVQKKLLEALLATGKPVVMLNFSGRPTVMSWESENVPAVMNVWFGGTEAADAIADVVFGDENPCGHLTASMPRNVGQIPIYYNHLNTGRPKGPWTNDFQKYRSNYIDVDNTPLYPFGYGLSYTDFEYSDFAIDTDSMTENSVVKASVKVTNTGKRAGVDVVQFYIHDVSASISRPVAELKHFERISLQPGESRTVTFEITVDSLKFYNYDLQYVAEKGQFEVMTGPDAGHLTALSFTLE